MILIKLSGSTGIPILTRDLMVGCCNNWGNHFREPMQTITPPGCVEGDMEIVTRVRTEVRQQGFTICGVSEVLRDFEMDELGNIFDGSDRGEYPTRALYIDVGMAEKGAYPWTDERDYFQSVKFLIY